jgi:Lipopolysaccharide-assembly
MYYTDFWQFRQLLYALGKYIPCYRQLCMVHTQPDGKRESWVASASHSIASRRILFFPGKSELLKTLRHPCNEYLWLLLVLSLMIGSVPGCGYTLVGSTAMTSKRRMSLAVTPFLNHTREPGLESHLTTALRQAIMRSQAFALATATTASQRVEGTIRRFRIYPLAFDENDNALQYRLEADVLVRLIDSNASGPTLEQEVSAWAEYLVSSTGVVRENIVAKEAALFRLAQRFADSLTALLIVRLL